MPVDFDNSRLEEVRHTHELWWEGRLDRPLMHIEISHPYERKSPAPLLSQKNCTDLSISPKELIDTIDEHLSHREYLGDAFPYVNFDAFGPGVLAAFCGAKLDNSTGGVWFFPTEELEIEDIHPRYDRENIWVKRIKSIYCAGLEKWQGSVIMGMPDLGGKLDVAATFRGTENLLMDCIDAPEEVERLTREISVAWYAAYNDFKAVLAPQKGFSDWSGLLSDTPSYIIQSDFSYMISESMFSRFALPELRKDTETLSHTIYHLDGIGQLRHIDDILALPDLNAMQWVFGNGKPSGMHWADVYKKIAASGKQAMVEGSPKDFLDILGLIHGSPYGRFNLRPGETETAEILLAAR